MPTFADLGLQEPLLEALREVGYTEPSPIQAESIPPLMEGLDVIGQAQTGSGKTAAFGLPMLNYIDPTEREVQGLVLTPTRELCIQVTQALRTYGAKKGIDVVAVFGGAPIRSQQAQLRAGGHVVVGTVGRVKDLISRHSLVLHSTRFVVLDEADEMLDLGFLDDVEKILSLTPSSRQTALFSATMPPAIQRLADQYLYDPVIVKVKAATLSVDSVEQFGLEVAAKDKNAALADVLSAERPDQAIVFVRTKIRADQLYKTLRDKGMNVKALHGDMSQGSRDGVMISFKEGRTPILVATDVAARGLDISTVTHVINFDVPVSPDIYVHRIGRTGRAGRSGRAITFYEPRQQRDLEAIEKHAGVKMAPWTKDAHVAPTAPKPSKPRRHSTKPHDGDVDAVETEVAVAESEVETPVIETSSPLLEAAALDIEASAPGAETAAPDAETVAPEVKTAAPAAEADVSDAEPAAPAPQTKPRPRRRRSANVKLRKLILAGGRVDGIEPADIIKALTAAGLDGEAVRNVRVLERFSFAEVPDAEADAVIAAASGTDIRGHSLALESARA